MFGQGHPQKGANELASTALPRRLRREEELPSENYVRKALPQRLGTFDMTMAFLMIMFFINNPVGAVAGGVAAFTYWIIGALAFFLPCIIATAQLGALYPNEGSLYNWTFKALGNFWSFFVGASFWVAGILAMVGSAGIAVTFLQGLNTTWLAEARLQGVFLVFILILSAVLAMQRLHILKSIVNMTTMLMICIIGLLGLAALFWVASGHGVSTNFGGGGLAIQPGNYVLFSTVILAYLGVNVTMTMGGEVKDRKVVSRHLFRGGLLVMAGYLIVTLALLVIEGPHAALLGPISVINAIDRVFGKFVANIAIACVIAFFIVLTALLNSIFARLLLAGAIDRRLPVGLGRLDENRVPLNAILFQTTVAVLFSSVVFLLPYLISIGNPINLANELFTVSLYAHSMIWAISSAFLFINLLVLYMRDRAALYAKLVVPVPFLWACIIVGPLACILAIIVTLSYSPIPQLIPTGSWGLIVGGLTVIWLIAAAMASLLAIGEAAWEDLGSEMR